MLQVNNVIRVSNKKTIQQWDSHTGGQQQHKVLNPGGGGDAVNTPTIENFQTTRWKLQLDKSYNKGIRKAHEHECCLNV